MKAIGKRFSGCYTHFGYFQECDEALRPGASCRAMLYRGSARYLPKDHPGANIILPLVLSDGKYGLVLIQVKGSAIDLLESISDDKASEVMSKCTLFGVFGIETDDDQKKYESFPVVRILFNLSSSSHNGARILTDTVSPFLIVQSDGTEFGENLDLKDFISGTIRFVADAINQKSPRYEAQFKDPPVDISSSYPFNPVYFGNLNDNDKNVFFGGPFTSANQEKIEMATQLLNTRPTYENI